MNIYKYRIIEIDGIIRAYICTNNKADKYGTPKEYKKLKDAKQWIERHSYGGMSFKYEIERIKI